MILKNSTETFLLKSQETLYNRLFPKKGRSPIGLDTHGAQGLHAARRAGAPIYGVNDKGSAHADPFQSLSWRRHLYPAETLA
jgi:hypothetical protein